MFRSKLPTAHISTNRSSFSYLTSGNLYYRESHVDIPSGEHMRNAISIRELVCAGAGLSACCTSLAESVYISQIFAEVIEELGLRNSIILLSR